MSPVITFGGLLGEATEGRIVNPVAFPRNVHSVLPSLAVHCCKMCCSLSILNRLTVIVQYGAGFFFLSFFFKANYQPIIARSSLISQSAIESLFGASLTGIAYSLFAGQPLTILGSTGPVLVFEKILFKFCKWVFIFHITLRASNNLSKDSSFIYSTHYISSRLHRSE